MFFADSHFSMGISLKQLANKSHETKQKTAEVDCSVYTLWQLLKERYELDAKGHSNRVRCLEEEIQKRCDHFQDSRERKGSAARGSRRRYRPYGFMLGVFFL